MRISACKYICHIGACQFLRGHSILPKINIPHNIDKPQNLLYYILQSAYKVSDIQHFTEAVQALSDETRLRMLNLIMAQECCVCEVMQALDISQTRASRNLKILHDTGFLKMRNDGLYTLYSINPETSHNFYSDLLEAANKSFNDSVIFRQDLVRLGQAKRVGPRCVGTSACGEQV
jgi:ArsR family transcriptional regulator, arsenate/arsenite/antimonite-responsive transcriptional repressor